jgi:hypothetical protein
VIPLPRHHDDARWTAGLDPAARVPGPGGGVRRLHAVGGSGLLEGRALCLAPVSLLDPAHWRWPDDGDEQWPLCWICLAMTHHDDRTAGGVPVG